VTINNAGSDRPLISVHDLEVTFKVSQGWIGHRSVRAVDGVSLDLHAGEVVALVGESGSGKTTLARSIAGLRPWSAGSVHYRGVNLADMTRRQLHEFRSRRGIVFQNPNASLNPRMRVEDALGEMLSVSKTVGRKQISSEIDRLLDSVALSRSYRVKFPLELSGGERQRVAIARAIAGRPSLFIADEITSALDVSVSAQIVNLVLDLRDELQFACLFITHDLTLALAVAQRVEIMRFGKVVDGGTPSYIANESTNQYTKILMTRQLDAVPAQDGGKSSISG
jgi:peptide/nickel transport system ATP-binding protein